MKRLSFKNLADEVVYLRALAENGHSLTVCAIQAEKVRRLTEQVLADHFEGAWFDAMLTGFTNNVIEHLSVTEDPVLSRTRFSDYHQNFAMFLRKNPDEKKFMKVLKLYRCVQRTIEYNGLRDDMIRGRITYLKRMLADFERQGKI